MKSLQIYQLADLPSSLFLMILHLDYGINSLMTDCWLLVSPRRDKPKLSRPSAVAEDPDDHSSSHCVGLVLPSLH